MSSSAAIAEISNDQTTNVESKALKLQSAAIQLEKNMIKDKVSNGLKRKLSDEVKMEVANLDKESNMASSLKSVAISLKKEQTKDAINKGLRKRASLEDLQNTGIMKKAAGPIQFQAQSEALKKAQTVDSLRQKWETRSSIDQLKQKGIVKNGPKRFQARSQSLEKARKMDALRQKFEKRSSLDSVKKQQIFKTKESVQKEQERKSITEQIIDQHIQQKVVESKNM